MVPVIRALAVLLALGLASRAQAQGEPPPTRDAHAEVLGFAYALMDEGDYYRAIGELKRYAYLEPTSPDTFPALLTIGRAYELGGKAADGAVWLQGLAPAATSLQLRADLLLEIGFAHHLAGDSGVAITELQDLLHGPEANGLSGPSRARAQYLLGWAFLLHGQGTEAAAQFQDVPLAEAHALADAARGLDSTPTKSPVVAGLLSAVIPGAGHFYLGLPGIGLAALAWNALFLFATYDAFHHHLWGVGAVLGGLETLWYGGAIFGAVSGAEKYNRDAQANYLDTLRSRYDPAPLSWPPSKR